MKHANLPLSLSGNSPAFGKLCFLLICLCSFVFSNAVKADESIKVQKLSKSAPTETMHFGRLVGKWKVKDQSLNKEGQWVPGPGADWNFYWILAGSAVQDDWISPGMDAPVPKGGRQFGTNIRIYNPKNKLWETAWVSNSGKKVDTFKATGSEESMIMIGIYNGQQTKITFHDITKNSFLWKMEKQEEKSGEWNEVYRISAEKVFADS